MENKNYCNRCVWFKANLEQEGIGFCTAFESETSSKHSSNCSDYIKTDMELIYLNGK